MNVYACIVHSIDETRPLRPRVDVELAHELDAVDMWYKG
jgi:hypothetical protein